MDFSAFNPQSTNTLNLAARSNNFKDVKRLLKKCNPNCVDNRGWTSLHEAAANDSFESLKLILCHPDSRPLAESFEGHTALYLSCQKQCSLKTIQALLEDTEDIANYASSEMVSPLHVVSMQGRSDVAQLLMNHGALINIQDFDGDTPLHDAAFAMKSETVSQLLHAGADAEIMNEAQYNPFHLACSRGCIDTVRVLHPFITDINMCTGKDDTPLTLATRAGKSPVVLYLLEQGADPHLCGADNELAIDIALSCGYSELFSILLKVTDHDKLKIDAVLIALNPIFFNMDIIITLFESNLGAHFFNRFSYLPLTEVDDMCKNYHYKGPLMYLLDIVEYIYNYNVEVFEKIFYLYLMRGISVNVLHPNEFPPLAYLSLCAHDNCFEAVFRIMLEHDVDVDWASAGGMPDALAVGVRAGCRFLPLLLRHSLACEPEQLLAYARNTALLHTIPTQVQAQILAFIDVNSEGVTAESLASFVPSLRHLSRARARRSLRAAGARSTRQYLQLLEHIPLPRSLIAFLRYN